jgi:hypothetical protein
MGINLAIKERSEKLAKLNKEINESNKLKQELMTYCHLAIFFINTIDNKISYKRINRLSRQRFLQQSQYILTHFFTFSYFDNIC